MTKSIRISETVHTKLKIHVAKRKKSIVEFADKAILKEISLDKAIEKNNRIIHSPNSIK